MASLSENIVRLRKEKNVTQEEAAKGSGIVLRSYIRYEKGEREPVASVLVRIANYYDLTTDYLLGRTDQRNDGNLPKS